MPGAVAQLEREFAAWLGVSGAVAAGFGRSALRLALDAMGCREADVLVPDLICSQVPQAIRLAGGRPVFYPVRRELGIGVEEFRAALTPATRVAVVPHYFGRVQPAIRELAGVCREREVFLLEDCALALGASFGGRRAGTFGDLAVFSFTKSDWCYGGGLLATNRTGWLESARRVLEEKFGEASRLAFVYGLLRRADFLANRPRWSGAAEHAGRWLERFSRLGGGNFYDAGRFDAAMPEVAARRARRILRQLDANLERRRAIHRQLIAALGDAAHVLLWPEPDPAETRAFLVLRSPAGRACEWVKQAGREGVTLRLTWPAYQELETGQGSAELARLAEHVVLLEVHPRLQEREIARIAACVRRLAARE